jgi:DNA-binding NarL/FixJ family response regulator
VTANGRAHGVIKVALVDDHALLRGGVRTLLEAERDIEIVAEASDGAEAIEKILAAHPDVVLMDVRMPKLDGIEATRRLAAAGSRARILVVTTFDSDAYVLEALRAGAAGFLLKDAPPERLADAVRTVAAGETLLDGVITRRLIESQLRQSGVREELRSRFEALTPREIDLVRRLARGLSNAELAREVHLSEATIKAHLTRILGKLGLRSRVQAVVLAYESGLVEPGDADLDETATAGA